MIKIVPIQYNGLEEVIKNIEVYKKKFTEESVIVFRDANMSLLEQENFNKVVGKGFGWNPYDVPNNYYQENHSHNEKINTAGSDEVMLSWHVEHPYYSNPIVAGMWNMFHLTAEEGAGKTYFINTSIIYDRLDKDSKKFLNSCLLKGPQSRQFDALYKVLEYPAISSHWLTGLPIITIPLNRNCENILSSVSGCSPTDGDQYTFKNIIYRIIEMIESDESVRMVHVWKQGDLVLMDGTLAHAVTGGFRPEEREFYGMWGHRDLIQYS